MVAQVNKFVGLLAVYFQLNKLRDGTGNMLLISTPHINIGYGRQLRQ